MLEPSKIKPARIHSIAEKVSETGAVFYIIHLTTTSGDILVCRVHTYTNTGKYLKFGKDLIENITELLGPLNLIVDKDVIIRFKQTTTTYRGDEYQEDKLYEVLSRTSTKYSHLL